MAEAETAPVPVIELRNVSKTFGEVRSLSGIDFSVRPGEIVGLLGDNGAGKSTLVKTIMGYHRPDPGGEIFFAGQRIDDWSVSRARSLGIETVYQERALCEKQPIWRNTRALHFDARLVILDEPTMGLSLTETRKTLDFIENIKARGKSAIFIDHNIFHVYPVVDRLYVLDRGRVAGTYRKDEVTMDELIERLYRVARSGSLH